ncbi:Uncharacterized protein Rs2_31111 [Raphanus sativus]|uniref:Conglutin beta 1 n=1 Tax=Raphanus sativus TaxID=3726 RepID=A0A6J0JN87_RAPSA|nr:conglutin beta 1 [Raphanus sativus]KAJ4891363.1 Uncharacterized protein Rs2_31111 [Raphanus sativus]
MWMEETSDVKRKMTPSIPANYVTILQLRERWIKEKQRKEQEEKDEERRRNQHAEEQQTIDEDPKKPREDLDEMRLNQSDQKKHRGGNSKKDESTGGGEARRGEEEEEETAAIGSERGEDDGLQEKKRGRRKRYDRKKKERANQDVEECGSIKTPECTVKEENNTPVKDQQLRVYKKKEEKAMGNKSVEKAVTVAFETQFKHLSIQRGQETKHLKALTRKNDSPLGRVGMPIETAAMVWVKKG